MSAGTYEYISEQEMREYRAQWQQLVNQIKEHQPPMIRVKVDERTTLEIAKGKDVRKVLKRYRKAREAYYAQD